MCMDITSLILDISWFSQQLVTTQSAVQKLYELVEVVGCIGIGPGPGGGG